MNFIPANDSRDDVSQIETLLISSGRDNERFHAVTMGELRVTREAIMEAIATEGQSNSSQLSNGLVARHSVLNQIKDDLARLTQTLEVIPSRNETLDRLWFDSIIRREHSVVKAHEGTFRWLLHEPSGKERRGIAKMVKRHRAWLYEPLKSHETSDSDDEVLDSDNETLDSHRKPNMDETTYKPCCEEIIDSEQAEIDNKTRDELETRERQRDAFVNWLRSGDGVFHISGKAGSGKSTLMKFLAREDKTNHQLTQWAKASRKELVFAQYFFWSSGDELQRSLEGLYRAILWDILSQCPELISRVFPDIRPSKHSQRTIPGAARVQTPFDNDELQSALDRLFGIPSSITDHPRLCLFIDGLDEYNGDYWKLSRSLLKWSSTGNVKFCVSSRPYTEFMTLFGTEEKRQLHLHDLTRFDMYQFVSSEFSTDGRLQSSGIAASEASKIVSKMIDKAEGIFLWIRLVTNELLKAIGNHCTSVQLDEKLALLPRDLSKLFSHMLDAIDDSEKRRAAQTLLAMTISWDVGHSGIERSLYLHWILDMLTDNPSMIHSIMQGNLEPQWSYDEWVSTRAKPMANKIVARCQGLVECNRQGEIRLDFTHRSVVDFLNHDEVQTKLREMVGSFNPHRGVLRAILAWIKFTKWPLAQISAADLLDYLMHGVISINNNLRSIVDRRTSEQEIECLVRLSKQVAESLDAGHVLVPMEKWYLDQTSKVHFCIARVPVEPCDVDAFITCRVISFGLLEVGLERVKRNPSLLLSQAPGGNVLLAAARPRIDKCSAPDIERLDYFIKLQCTNSNALCPVYYGEDSNSDRDPWMGSYLTTPPWTVWTAYLFTMVQARWALTNPRNLRTIRTFLENGADASVCFVGYMAEECALGTEGIGLCHVTLLDMITYLGFTIAPDMVHLFTGPPRASSWSYFKEPYKFFTQAGKSLGHQAIPRLDLRCLTDERSFRTLKIVSSERLREVPLDELETLRTPKSGAWYNI